MPEKNWSVGRSINGAKQIPGTTTDCSGWASHIPADQWSEGRSINAAKQIPGTSTDCSKWGLPAPVWVAIRVRYAADVSKDVVTRHTAQVIEKLQSLAPDLGLEYDEARSVEPADKRSVTIAVSPTVLVANLEDRLHELLRNMRTAEPSVPIVALAVEWDQPLAA